LRGSAVQQRGCAQVCHHNDHLTGFFLFSIHHEYLDRSFERDI